MTYILQFCGERGKWLIQGLYNFRLISRQGISDVFTDSEDAPFPPPCPSQMPSTYEVVRTSRHTPMCHKFHVTSLAKTTCAGTYCEQHSLHYKKTTVGFEENDLGCCGQVTFGQFVRTAKEFTGSTETRRKSEWYAHAPGGLWCHRVRPDDTV